MGWSRWVSGLARWTVASVPTVRATALTLAVLPGIATAHELSGSRFDAPLPLSWLFAGAGATVALTALWLLVRSQPPAKPAEPRAILTIPASVARPARTGARWLFLAAVVAAVVAGVADRQVPAENLATVFTWPVWVRGVAILAILVGSPWRTLSPWRTVYGLFERLEGREIALLGRYPSALAEWPAVVGFVLLLGLVENLTVVPRSPRLTAGVVAAYGLVMIAGALLAGPAWLRRADPLGVFYRLLGRVSMVSVTPNDDGGVTVTRRAPWRGCLPPVDSVALVVFVVATVYTVSFDGFTNTRRYQTVLFDARAALGTGPGTGVVLYLLGLLGFVGGFLVVSRVVERLGTGNRTRNGTGSGTAKRNGTGSGTAKRNGTGNGLQWVETARWFAPTLIPIAAAYELAHTYPYVAANLGQLVVVVLGGLGPGVGPIDPLAWLSVPAFWASQVVLVVLGHVVAVVAAHAVAVERYAGPAAARRAHLPLVVLMVGYTVLSLWIVSRPVVG